MEVATLKERSIWETLIMLKIGDYEPTAQTNEAAALVIGTLQALRADAAALRNEPTPASAPTVARRVSPKPLTPVIAKDFSTVANHKPNCQCVYHKWLRKKAI